MFGNIDKSMLFVASFSPLWAIMIVGHMLDNHADHNSWIVSLVLSAAVAFSIVFVVRKFRAIRRSTNPKHIEVTRARETTVGLAPYIMVYMFSILVQVDDPSGFFVMFATMSLVGIIYVRTGMVLTNPAFIIAGFRIYEVDADDYARPFIIISKQHPAGGIWVRDCHHDLCIEQETITWQQFHDRQTKRK